MKAIFITLCFAISTLFIACNGDDENPVEHKKPALKYLFEFKNDTQSWIGDFADYPDHSNIKEFYELDYGFSGLPDPLDNNNGSIMQTGNNHSDDLFMFAKKKISGLKPEQEYHVNFEIEIATNVANGQMGVGGAPGESVYIKAGATSVEPIKVLDNSDNHFRMNIDKGNQAMGGKNMQLIGNFANDTDKNIYKLKKLSTEAPVYVTSNSEGEIWVIVGTDSGFEATTTIYYNSIFIDLDEK